MNRVVLGILVISLASSAAAAEPTVLASEHTLRGAAAWGAGVAAGGVGAGFLLLTLAGSEGVHAGSAPMLIGAALVAPVLATLATTWIWTAGRRSLGLNALVLSIGVHALAIAQAFLNVNDVLHVVVYAGCLVLMPLGVMWQEDAEPRALPTPRPVDARPITRSLLEVERATSFTLVAAGW